MARSDYGACLPVLRLVRDDSALHLHLMVSGMHLSGEFGLSVKAIEQDGFEIAQRIEMLVPSDSPEGIARSMGQGVIGFARAFAEFKPDLLLVLGDRFEMHAAVAASLPFKIPVAHIHGGESTEGAIDEALRHSITKMSHLHFAATEHYASRIIRMGEEPWRVVVSGAPGLDNLRSMKLLSRSELAREFGIDLTENTLLVTCHPVTLEYEKTESQVRELLSALDDSGMAVVFTCPNADTRSRVISRMIGEFAARHQSSRVVKNLGTRGYFSVMSHAAAMVGNSSSGIIEAPSLKLPVVNVGNRQRGRVRAKNVIDVSCSRAEILEGIREAVSPEFRRGLCDLVNPYGDGHAARRIVEKLKEVSVDEKLLLKRFHEPGAGG